MATPDVIVVGAATRDLTEDDPRGWFMGGGVTFSALTLARLGLRVGLVIGLDPQARGAREVQLIASAGAEIIEVPLDKGPMFINDESGPTRVQTCMSTSDRIPTSVVPREWRTASTWMLTPIASEIGPEWMDIPTPEACVAFAWQGELRILSDGAVVRPRLPGPSAFLERSDIIALSRHDLPASFDLTSIGPWLKPRADVLLTAGLAGGLLLEYRDGRIAGGRAYPSVPSRGEVDPVGAGDTMLAGVVAARMALSEKDAGAGQDVHFGAAVSALLVEGHGIDAIPTLERLRERMAEEA
jgi:sugar/nucleoside kinase (ribokinase family)